MSWPGSRSATSILAMIVWLRHVLGWLRSAFCAREDLILENLALRYDNCLQVLLGEMSRF
jgi:hypothetical protein